MVSKLQKMRDRLMAKKGNKGFTLVELIVVIVILAILVGVTIGGVYGYVNKSRINTDINNASAIASALAPISTMKNVTVTGATANAEGTITKVVDVSTAGIAADAINASSFGLTATLAEGATDPVKTMFPQGLEASKSGGKYLIKYSYDKTAHVTSVSVQAVKADGSTPLEAQE